MDETEQLIERWFLDELSPKDLKKLTAICREQKAVRQRFAAMVESERMLKAMGPGEAFDESFCAEVRARIDLEFNESPDFSDAKIVARIESEEASKRFHFGIGLKIAAGVALFLGLSLISLLKTTQPTPEFLATITSVEGVLWSSQEFENGIPAGSGVIAIERGFIELEFPHKTRLLIEGPARFNIINPMLMELSQGKLVAQVPEKGHGFRVICPDAEVIDLGTGFGVEALHDQKTEVHVLQGKVKAKATWEIEYQELTQDEALTADSSVKLLSNGNAQPDRFLDELPDRSTKQPVQYAHWSFDEGSGSRVQAGYNHSSSGVSADGLLRMSRDPEKSLSKGPKWIDGVFGSALQFDGQGSFVQTDYRGISGNQARTLAFWVKADPESRAGYAILGWGAHPYEEGKVWQASLNPQESDGPVGGLRLGIHGQTAICDTDLRDGQWHHCAIVLYPGTLEDIPLPKQLMLFYIDGELQHANRHTFLGIDTGSAENASPVVMGTSAGHKRNRTFDGCLDEIYLIDKPLSQFEIRTLMRENRL